jgi:histidinol-phosphate aminotransferase
VIKLASNENPLGPSPKAVAALQQALAQAHRYPGVAERDLRRRLATHHELPEEAFIIGNGGTDVLRMIAQGFIFDGGETVMGRVTFPLYRLLTIMFGGKPLQVEPRADLALDLPAMADAVGERTRILWLCSPNNPTGLALAQAEAEALLNRLPGHVVVAIDESYCAYTTMPEAVDSVSYVREGRPVIAVRSFSKTAGLANLRVGYGIGRPDLIEYLMHTVLPFNTGGPAMQAAMASLDDSEHARASLELVEHEREFLIDGMGRLGLNCLPSQANFVLVRDVPGGGESFADRLMRQGIIVRPMVGFGLPGSVRVSVGTRPENQRLLKALVEVLNAAPARGR